MNYFWKLQTVSMLYAVLAFVPVELMLNVYRISRMMNWDLDTVIMLSTVTSAAAVIGGTFLLYQLTGKWLGRRKANFWTAVLWFPYFVLFLYVFATFFPITYRGDLPAPVSGLVMIGGCIVYPFYIGLLNAAALSKSRSTRL